MKKILFVTSTLEPGGVASVLADLSLELSKEYEVTILLNDTTKVSYSYGGTLISLGMRQQVDRTNIWYQAKVFLRRVFKLCRLKRTKEYDVCISMLDSANVANIISGKRHCKVITTVFTNISSLKEEKKVKYIIPAIKMLYNKSDFLIITSKGVLEDLHDNYGIKRELMKVIYDGVNLEEISEKSKADVNLDLFDASKPTAVTLGRLVPAKAQWHLIRAFMKVNREIPNAQLYIIGEGPLKDELQQLINSCGLSENVVLLGYVKNPFSIIANSTAFVMSSAREGYPTVLLEAMVCGAPCICTDFDSGAREILAPNTDIQCKQTKEIEYAEYGIITPACDGIMKDGLVPLSQEENLLADAITKMLSNEELHDYYCNKIKNYAVTFSIGNCAKEWKQVIESIC